MLIRYEIHVVRVMESHRLISDISASQISNKVAIRRVMMIRLVQTVG